MKQWQDFVSPKKCRKPSSQSIFLLFSTISALFALCLFLYGFFPMKTANGKFSAKEEIPTKILNLSIDNKALYQRHVGRLVFVLIDAFRWDFVENSEHMPYISELRKLKQATILTARCHPPTATMPRVKAMMTGTVPNYIDVILNLGSNQVMEDNLIHQAVDNDLKLVFYGDEMWPNLFPHKFIRHEGTESFFVFDYTEVDHNVTRNIATEMKKDDWDILILHYLGLDHIGHFAGPNSDLIRGKLIEMDLIIKMLHGDLQKWDMEHPEVPPSFLVVAGDHGMHDSGSHGGASLGEILTSVVLIENFPHNISLSEGRPEVSQIDLAATLSVLLGLPIPASSLGALIPHALGRLNQNQYLFSLFYNAQVVASQFLLTVADGRLKGCFAQYLEAQSVHLSWLQSGSEDLRHLAEKLYFNATQEMGTFLVKKLVTFDESALVISCLILIQVPLCLFLIWAAKTSDVVQKKGIRVFITFIAGLTTLFICGVCEYFSASAHYFSIFFFSIFIIALHCWTLFKVPYCMQGITFWKLPFLSVFLRVGSVLHTVSFSSSSFIEEEHQTWYFLWITLILLTFLKKSTTGCYLHPLMIGILLGHRLLRKLNQTGDKWSSSPDITGWLEMPQHHMYLLFVFILGLFGVWRSLLSLKCISYAIDKVLLGLSLSCVLLYRRAVGDISFAYLPAVSRGIREVQLFWFILGLIFLRSLIRLKQNTSLKEGIKVLILIMMLTSTLLLRPSNVILISYVVLSSSLILSYFRRPVDCTISHVWLGMVVYFYQGNSNSLATVDVTVGYIGTEQQNMNMITAGLLVFIYTFSFPILATFLLWLGLASEPQKLQRKEDLLTSLIVSLLQRLLPLSIYCILITFQREHLFIWSVFAPKLLCETLHTVLCFITVALGFVLLMCFDN